VSTTVAPPTPRPTAEDRRRSKLRADAQREVDALLRQIDGLAETLDAPLDTSRAVVVNGLLRELEKVDRDALGVQLRRLGRAAWRGALEDTFRYDAKGPAERTRKLVEQARAGIQTNELVLDAAVAFSRTETKSLPDGALDATARILLEKAEAIAPLDSEISAALIVRGAEPLLAGFRRPHDKALIRRAVALGLPALAELRRRKELEAQPPFYVPFLRIQLARRVSRLVLTSHAGDEDAGWLEGLKAGISLREEALAEAERISAADLVREDALELSMLHFSAAKLVGPTAGEAHLAKVRELREPLGETWPAIDANLDRLRGDPTTAREKLLAFARARVESTRVRFEATALLALIDAESADPTLRAEARSFVPELKTRDGAYTLFFDRKVEEVLSAIER
jgi:hypothetical protein